MMRTLSNLIEPARHLGASARLWVVAFSVTLCLVATARSEVAEDFDPDFEDDAYFFDDQPRKYATPYPDWFKLSLLDLPDDLNDAVQEGKKGIMVYFGQDHCAYCEKLLEVNFGDDSIAGYTRENFDVIALDVWGDRGVVDMQGRALTEKQMAERERTNFTPSIIFYDSDGDEAFRLRGYYPPYKFRAALEYVVSGTYLQESFRDYLSRGEASLAFESDELNEEDFFFPPPHVLDRSHFPGEKPLIVLFEQGNCHACDVLHAEQFQNPVIQKHLQNFEVVQLDMWADTPLITPDGRRLRAREWAAELGLFHSPSMLFFDEQGQEVFRIESVVHFFRLSGTLDFIGSGDYKKQPFFIRWREEQQKSSHPSAEGLLSSGL